MKGINYTLLLLLLPIFAFTQQKWEWGLFLGGANYQGDLVKSNFPIPSETGLAYGLYGAYYLHPAWSLEVNGFRGEIKGTDQNFDLNDFTEKRNFNFKTTITEVGLSLNWEPFGKKRLSPDKVYKNIISPYLFAGVAIAFTDPVPDFSNAPRDGRFPRIQADKSANYNKNRLSIPIGLGVKFDVSRKLSIGLEFGARTAFTDYLDGISQSANPDRNDWYQFAGVTFGLKFGPPDADNDGIVDDKDACPRVKGVLSARGCPDRDGDGVEDLEDVCPNVAGIFEFNGCPDTDGDQIIDKLDKCPTLFGLEITDGCPDTDGDLVADIKDVCPNEFGSNLFEGCPDCDGDGIINSEDDCPEEAGSEKNNGCPFVDIDGDGIDDEKDDCPRVKGLPIFNGCPDTDGDGVKDNIDKCPTSVGTKNNNGCPEITEEVKKVLSYAPQAIEFETGSAKLKAKSKKILDQIAGIMVEFSDYSLKITGHTDSVGKAKSNQVLSENRAKSCYEYLISKDINKDRMQFLGKGEIEPIASNKTSKGRKLNRRVAFDLYLK